ncbi:hypothetical protein LQ327_16705 [Actinomycetospora endophytica]|uniref:DUF7715 domain-containing protein n=1 Tax=Actinomycetospora endophytica TaxID=2291215 RepID=A0ABS8P9Q4_9PSEU|nr:hypothetical protein [Actinomycetospora endophytica]MCD2195008.1 hypothetical protein [Actinomycetospora endophytica]
MKVLVATGQTQGTRENDYHWAIEGELVRIGEVCATDRRDPDGGCGCGRGFAGLSSHRATTTTRVAELAMDRSEFGEAVRSGLVAQGWELSSRECAEVADELADLAAQWPVGAVLERRLDVLTCRALLAGCTGPGSHIGPAGWTP